MAVGDEGAHAELAGERQRLAVIGFRVLGAACQRDVTGEAECMYLVSSSPQSAGEGHGFSRVTGGLVDPSGRKVDNSRVKKYVRRPPVTLAGAGLLHRARDQREGLVSRAGESACGAESRRGERPPDGELPCPAEIETALEGPRRAR